MDEVAIDREAILRRFETWLDKVLAQEEPPQGTAAEMLSAVESDPVADSHCDLYSMWAALTALTQEVKLQGRSFKQLSETLVPLGDLHPRVDAVLKAHQGAVAELRSEAERSVRREVLDALLDLRDSLHRGLDAARGSEAQMRASGRNIWFDKLFTARKKASDQALETVAALKKGYELSAERLDEILERFHVRAIPCLNQPFDPGLMSAVDLEETTRVPEGTVVEVYRTGYEWEGELYRTAQVKVSRLPGAGGEGNE